MTHLQRTPLELPLLTVLAVLSALVVAAGCRATPAPPPLVAPAIQVEVHHYMGSPLSGPSSHEPVAEGASALLVGCRVVYLESMPLRAELEPLAARTRLIGAARGGQPVLASAVLARGARVGTGESARDILRRLESGELGRSLELVRADGALPVGVTAAFRASGRETIEVPDLGKILKKLELHVSHEDEGAPSLVLIVEDLAAPRAANARTDEEDAPVPEGEILHREMICLEDRPGPTPLVLFFHSPFGEATGAFAVVIEVLPGEGPRHEDALALCLAQLDAAAAEASDTPAEDWASRHTTASALRALEVPRLRRSALFFLATKTGAPLAEDLALAGEEVLLSGLATSIREALGDAWGGSKAETGWLLEREAYLLLSRLQVSNPPLPPELAGILLRHAGAVGRTPGLVQEIVAHSDGLDGFETWLLQENRVFLEDSNPGARVRALDWLATRGITIDGYDPLASPSERREALATAIEAATTEEEVP